MQKNSTKTLHALPVVVALFLASTPVGSAVQQQIDRLDRVSARLLFQHAVDKSLKPDVVLDRFQRDGQLPLAVRTAYIGALQALMAREASFPLTKVKWMKQGMATLNEARRLDSINVEVIFIQGMVCYRVPKIFGYRDDAKHHFAALVRLLPEQWKLYEPGFVREVLNFLQQETTLSARQREILAQIEKQMDGLHTGGAQ